MPLQFALIPTAAVPLILQERKSTNNIPMKLINLLSEMLRIFVGKNSNVCEIFSKTFPDCYHSININVIVRLTIVSDFATHSFYNRRKDATEF